jgi:hypothetical protein
VNSLGVFIGKGSADALGFIAFLNQCGYNFITQVALQYYFTILARPSYSTFGFQKLRQRL